MLAATLAAVAGGCAGLAPDLKPLDGPQIAALNGRAAEIPYRLAPGDRLLVKFSYNRDMNEEVVVRTDGRISLPLVGEVPAAGRTPEELTRALTAEYGKSFGTDPQAYVIGIGERLSIKSFYQEKLNEDVIVRPDGKISMQLAGEVQAAGVTPAQLAAAIIERLRRFVDKPDISVIVREFRRPDLSVMVRESALQRVYVGGEVRQAGVLPLHAGLGLLGATLQSGGALETASLDNVMLIRHHGLAQPETYAVDVRGILQGRTPDVALRPLDVVYVPKTVAAETAAALRQNVYNFIPPQFQAVLGYQLNPQVEVSSRVP